MKLPIFGPYPVTFNKIWFMKGVMKKSSSQNAPTLYALLVGINEYQSNTINSLSGCINDTNAVYNLLIKKFEMPPENILLLANKEATREGITRAFRSHLIGNAKRWKEAPSSTNTEPAFLFYYAGHGSRTRARKFDTEDKRFETLVPHDSRTHNVYDIKDWEIEQWIAELNHYSDKVTIIADSCNSGGITRNLEQPSGDNKIIKSTVRLESTEMVARGIEPDQNERDIEPLPEKARDRSGEIPAPKYVLLSGCAHNQLSKEGYFTLANTKKQVPHGVMTWHLVKILQRMQPDHPLTYREVHQKVRKCVQKQSLNQTPYCLGDRDREFLGGVRPTRDLFLNVTEFSDGIARVDGGVINGLLKDTELAVYPESTRTLAKAGRPLGFLKVVEAGATQCFCVPLDHFTPLVSSNVTVSRLSNQKKSCPLVIDIDDPLLKNILTENLESQQAVRCFSVLPDGVAGMFRIAMVEDDGSSQLEIQDANGLRLVAPYPAKAEQIPTLVRDLHHIAQWQEILKLTNSDPNSELSGKVSIQLVRQLFDKMGDPIIENNKEQFECIPDCPTPEVMDGERLAIQLTNQSDFPLYFSVFSLSLDYEITRIYPLDPGDQKPINPHSNYIHGSRSNKTSREGAIRFHIPKSWPEGPEYLKVIATKEPAHYDNYEQGPLRSPTRGCKPELEKSCNDDWATTEISYRMLPQGKARQVCIALPSEWKIDPQDFVTNWNNAKACSNSASARLSDQPSNTRSIDLFSDVTLSITSGIASTLLAELIKSTFAACCAKTLATKEKGKPAVKIEEDPHSGRPTFIISVQ